MSSAVNDLKVEEHKKEENEPSDTTVKAEEKPNLMTFIPKNEDNYLDTLRNFGITVKCVPKRGCKVIPIVEPKIEPKDEDDDDENLEYPDEDDDDDDNDSVDINHLLGNSSISIVKKVTRSNSTASSSKSVVDEDDPIAKLSQLGSIVSIARKKSTESGTNSSDKPIETESVTVKPVEKSVNTESITVKPIEKSITTESVTVKPIEKSVTAIEKPVTSIENSVTSIEKPVTSIEPVTSIKPITEKSISSIEKPVASIEPITSVQKSTPTAVSEPLLTEIKEEPGLEEEEFSDRSKSTEPEKENSRKTIRANTSKKSRSRSRRNSNTSSLASNEHLEEHLLENFNKENSQVKVTIKRGGKRGRGRPRGAVNRVQAAKPSTSSGRTSRGSRRGHHYESDEDFDCHVRTPVVTRRQTRGKKISLSNYSESEDSDFERYINENTESPIDYLSEFEKNKVENTSAENTFRKSDIEIPPTQSQENESQQDSSHLESEQQSEENKSEIQDLNEAATSSQPPTKLSIKILQNEDYSEVLNRSQSEIINEETLEHGDYNETPPSEDGGESENLSNSISRSVTPSTGYLSDSSKTDEIPSKKRRLTSTSTSQTERYPSDELFCWYCKRNFSKKTLFWRHISTHIRLPHVYLTKVTPEEIEHHCGPGYRYIPSGTTIISATTIPSAVASPKMSSLKLKLKTNNNHEFEIINKENNTMESTQEEFEGDEYDPNLEDNMDLENEIIDNEITENEISETNDDNMDLDDPIDMNLEKETEVIQDEVRKNIEENNTIVQNSSEENDNSLINYEETSQTEGQSYENLQDTTNYSSEKEPTEVTDKISDENSGSETSQQTYIPGVRIRSLESVQRLENGTPESTHSQSSGNSPSLHGSSPTLRVRTNLTSPQSNNISHMQNQLAATQNMYGQPPQQQTHDPYQNQHGGYNVQNPYMNPHQMSGHQPQNMYTSQQSMTYNNNGYSSYSSYNQTTYVANGNYSPGSSYWPNTGQGGDTMDPLAINPEDDPLKLSQSGEKEKETNDSLLKSFLDAPNSNVNPGLGNDSASMAEFMPLDRLISACQICSERFPDAQSLEEHKRRLNHYSNSSMPQHPPSSALQPLGTTALQTLANAHGPMGAGGMQPIQHQIRVQHNVIVNNVIQQPPMAPLPPYGQPQSMVDNSMQQLAQQVNRMPPPSSQYGPYGPSQPPPPYGSQSPYRMPALPAPPGQGPQQGYNQNNSHYGSQYGQYPNNQPIALPAPPSSSNQQGHPSQQQYSQQRPPQQQARPNAPGVPNLRPRGQAFLPSSQAGSPLAPPPPGMRVPVRGTYRPPAFRGRTGPQMATRMQGPPPPRGPTQSVNQATRMRRPMPPNQQQQNNDPQKRKRMDVLLPDRHDDPDCHVIAVQQRNDDLPVIQNIQGNVTETAQDPLSKVKDSMIHLTDSITLSVRGKENNGGNSQSPTTTQPSPANAVADILATRGITVTPAAKSNNSSQSRNNDRPSDNNAVAQVAINLNNAVSIIPAQKSNSVERPARPPSTVDLTDEEHAAVNRDSSLIRPNKPYKCSICPKQFNSQDLYTLHVAKHRTLPFRCDRCPAAYPKQADLLNHKKNCRANTSQNANTANGSNLGLPVVDLRRPQVLQTLSRIGIYHYIPLAQGNESGCFGLPIVSVDGTRNPNIVNLSALGSNNLLPLGPIQQIPIQNNRPH